MSDGERELIEDLMPFFKISIFAFSAVVVLRLLVFVVPLGADSVAYLIEYVIEWIDGPGYTDYVFGIPEALNVTARIITGIAIVFLFLTEAVLVIVNLKPLFEADEEQIQGNRRLSKMSNKRR